jgi:hypothetical protein
MKHRIKLNVIARGESVKVYFAGFIERKEPHPVVGMTPFVDMCLNKNCSKVYDTKEEAYQDVVKLDAINSEYQAFVVKS